MICAIIALAGFVAAFFAHRFGHREGYDIGYEIGFTDAFQERGSADHAELRWAPTPTEPILLPEPAPIDPLQP